MGTIEVITGPMFCGKSEELLRRLRKARVAGWSTKLIKPLSDTRDRDNIKTRAHDQVVAATAVESLAPIYQWEVSYDWVGIDEAQFFDGEELWKVARYLARHEGARVVIAGLDMDWKMQPFRCMADAMGVADTVTKMTAVCTMCKGDATLTSKLCGSEKRIEVEGEAVYQPRCGTCFAFPDGSR